MLKPRRPSAALVVACLALAITLSGVSYAAVTLPRNSVGPKQLKANAVSGPKVKNNSLGGADVNEASLQGLVKTGAAAGGSLAGTFPNPTLAPNSVGANEVGSNALGTADIDESTLDVLQGKGGSSTGSRALLPSMSYQDVVPVPGAGFIQVLCDGLIHSTIRYSDTSGSLTYVWTDTGAADPINLLANPNAASTTTFTTSDFDLLTLWVRPGAAASGRSIVHLAISNEGGLCNLFWTVQRVVP